MRGGKNISVTERRKPPDVWWKGGRGQVGPDMHGLMGHGRRLCIYPKNNGQLLEIFKEKELGDGCGIHMEENQSMCRYQLS